MARDEAPATRPAQTPDPRPAQTPDPRPGRADIHLHTNLGDGTASPARVVEEARQRGLDVIAVTDHDHLEGAKRVADLLARERELGERDPGADERPLPELIWGCEITTRDGHFIGLFLQRPVRMLQRVEATIEAVKEQGGLCVVPHPMGRLVPSLGRRKIEELLERGYALDAIELYNPSPANAGARAEVRRLNEQWGLAATGGSDAHFWQHIGAGYTLFPGRGVDDLRRAIVERASREGGQERRPERLPVAAYALQFGWSWFVDPPRKVARMLRQRAAAGAGASGHGDRRTAPREGVR
jgi:predicted metal-dependent phosphoesterase TrpH